MTNDDALMVEPKLSRQRRAERQDMIAKYGKAYIAAEIARVCVGCQFGLPPFGRCEHGLLPLDGDGNTGCIYRQAKAARV